VIVKILICYDGSESSINALLEGSKIAQKMEAEVIVLTVIETITCAGLVSSGDSFMSWTALSLVDRVELIKNTGLSILKKAEDICEQLGVLYSSLFVDDSPPLAICRVAEERDVDLIVLGSRGLTVLSRILLGSVSKYVVTNAPCSVLVVRPRSSKASS
jgi:nucleotide-binding universal stress UspA family protein